MLSSKAVSSAVAESTETDETGENKGLAGTTVAGSTETDEDGKNRGLVGTTVAGNSNEQDFLVRQR